ncbi:MAG: glycoside hydrolase family 125 protein, partial [Prevotella sp.]|nr:glycoside hydrolase family 125 protein [Prevotella sp.]
MKKFNLLSILFALTFASNTTANTMTNTLCAPTEIKADVLKVNNRPVESKRLFRSDAVEKKIKEVVQLLTNHRLAWMFVNCFPNTIDTTVHFTESDEEGNPDTFVYTGDIHAMCLRKQARSKKSLCRQTAHKENNHGQTQ